MVPKVAEMMLFLMLFSYWFHSKLKNGRWCKFVKISTYWLHLRNQLPTGIPMFCISLQLQTCKDISMHVGYKNNKQQRHIFRSILIIDCGKSLNSMWFHFNSFAGQLIVLLWFRREGYDVLEVLKTTVWCIGPPDPQTGCQHNSAARSVINYYIIVHTLVWWDPRNS